MRTVSVIAWAGLALGNAVPAPAGGQDVAPRPVQPMTAAESMRMFTQVLNQLRVNHGDSLPVQVLMMAAVEGMVRAADPHSYVLPAVRLSPEKEAAFREGELVPVPIHFAFIEDAPVVVGVHAGQGGPTLDILPGDELIRIDGRPVTAESPEELEIVLAGAEGSPVLLTLSRRRLDGSAATIDRMVQRRDPAAVPGVVAGSLLDDSTGYIRIAHFNTHQVADEFRAAFADLAEQGMEHLVLDLRENPGGLVEEAAEVAGTLLSPSAIVYISEGRRARDNDTVRVSDGIASSSTLPVVVLVDGGTASAAELVAGALQDHDRALIAGNTTFGKSLLMRRFPLTDGSVIALAVGRLKTPCGRVIQRPYRDLRTRDYYEGVGAARDTSQMPRCRSARGRTLYGGGGVRPDVYLPIPDEPPAWVSRVAEAEIPLRWLGRVLADSTLIPQTVEEFQHRARLPPPLVTAFTNLAAEQGVDLPAGIEGDPQLHGWLMLTLVWGRWGERAYYEVLARWDPEVAAAAEEMERAARLITPSGAPR